MKKFLFLLPLFLFADVNPFNAGLNSPNPYGLTTDEKYILQNKKNINILQKKLNHIQKTVNQIKLKLANYDEIINDRLSAFPTVIDEVNTAMNDISKLKLEFNQTKTKIENIEKRLDSLENNITSIKLSIKEIIKTQNENIQILKNTLNEIIKKIDNMNKPISPKKTFLEAKKAFFANKLDKAKEGFLFSLSKKYLPATSSYYLGEIAYKKKNYKEALAFYKKSVNFYPKKTSYMPRLLYHTAISFEKLGNTKGAVLTLQKLINDFPKSKYLNLAKKELEKLK